MVHFNLNSFVGLLLIVRSLYPATAIAGEAAATATPAQTKHVMTNGSPVEISELGIKLTPPAGWEMIQGRPNISLILQKPLPAEPSAADKTELPKGDAAGVVKITYQPNIVLAAMHRPLPIDEKSAGEITEQIAKKFREIGGISNFQLQQDAKIFEYRAGAKALVVYATYTMNDVTLGQMHMVFSGKENSFLMTYTDLAGHFMGEGAEKNRDYQDAFNTMLSFEAAGSSPIRYREEIILGAIVASCAFILIALLVWARKRSGSSYHDLGDAACYDSDELLCSKRDFEDDAEEPISAAMFMDNDDGLDLDSRHAMKGWDIESSEHGHEKAHEEELVWNLAPQKVAARS